ncbi:mersacidin/lichenicidin family type 2 lantibiotic [Spirulina sp. CS-785/01]|uniref:mersacidin/lichenicidin family type 2 lantibiotic n=1 Tax=Spirulina sp. CS-785/01 TaxID=3021716 RepID=UPI00232FCE80|nr:mersacidin/lichenicidin family type 2 lantibiotic [Spirulina sp. CS-785/01]MDB9313140.1 mersacidin/lichenicidin family type 2 lantibiotic [Spirulina sp. CS-785/01]
MSNIDIIRAWKDEAYRASLSEEQRSLLPDNPAGLIELSDDDMSSLSGGCTTCTGGTGITHTWNWSCFAGVESGDGLTVS